MAELLVPADVEVAAVAELNTRMPPAGYAAKWGTRIPNPRTPEFGRVLVVGGTERDLVTDTHTLLVEGWAETETTAQRMCAFGVAVLQAAARDGSIGNVPCYRVRVASLPQNLPDPTVPDRFRFTATVSVDLRRSTV